MRTRSIAAVFRLGALTLLSLSLASVSAAVVQAQAYPPSAPTGGGGAATVRQAAGAAGADIQGAVDAFRADLGGANNAANAPAADGRREINWDGVPDARSAPNDLPADFFNTTSPRGVVFVSTGPGFQVSANDGVAAVRFATLNPAYEAAFSTFTAQRLFSALDANTYEVRFFVPGTTTPALTRGFGAVFTNVRMADATSIEYFDAAGQSLGRWSAPTSAPSGLSFLGVSWPDAVVSWVRITAGTVALGPYAADSAYDNVVALDDFIYGEPRAR